MAEDYSEQQLDFLRRAKGATTPRMQGEMPMYAIRTRAKGDPLHPGWFELYDGIKDDLQPMRADITKEMDALRPPSEKDVSPLDLTPSWRYSRHTWRLRHLRAAVP